ncbi:hypothetical protein BY458DRAFT_546317 [Sporodiniella umbellata]|nr:hypothetical protein BY458DRAFT_546317 [Sporodiniella umbellata]
MNSAVQFTLHGTDPSHCHSCQCCCFQFYEFSHQIPSPGLIRTSDTCSCCSCFASDDNDDQEYVTNPDEENFNKKKSHAIEELLQTERDYVDDLSHLSEVCLQVLNRQPWISSNHKITIKRNIDDILSFHLDLINSLNAIRYNGSMIAKTLLDQISHFSLYKQYCEMHSEAWSLVSVYRNRSEWANFIKECSTQDTTEDDSLPNQHKRLHFEDYLIKPIQRICRYQLLIKEIARYTSTHSPEYDLWTALLSEMQDIVLEVDNLKFQRDMKERTDRFIERLEGDWRINKKHVARLGHFLVAGAIEVTYSALGQSVSKAKYLGCIVFPTYMIMVRPKKVTNYEPKHWFPLKMAELENLEDIEGQTEHSFIIRCKKHSFVLSATCTQEKQMWVKKIQDAIIEAKLREEEEDQIVSSLVGVTPTRQNLSMRPSRSFSHILDLTLANNDKGKLERPHSLRQPISTIQEDTHQSRLSYDRGIVKRYSADYATNQKKPELKPRNHSETYVKPEFPGPRRRPSSLDILSDTSVIGKMSIQFKNNHQNAMRHNVDHKLREVCTEDYLSSRAWYMRDTFEAPVSPTQPIEKRKSLLRNSVSNLSLMVAKRSETKPTALSSEAETVDESLPSTSTEPKNLSHTSKSPATNQQSDESFDCTFHLVPSTVSNCSLKGRKKSLKQRVLRQIASIRNMKSSISEWRMSADTLKSDTIKGPKKHSSLKNLTKSNEDENNHLFLPFAYAATPTKKKKKSWKARLPKIFMKDS